MMKRNYLWMLLASMAFVGCSQNDDLPEGGEQNNEKEISYIAINVNATPTMGGRAATSPGFSYGTADENKVSTVCFFFFDGSGNPFTIATGTAADGTTATANWITKNYSSDQGSATTGSTNVERVMESVLVLQKVKGSYPKSVVAVLNWTPTGTAGISLEQLRKTSLTEFKNSNFIISNSVYKSGSNVIYATPLTEAHFAANTDAAVARPVDIYVERVAVKTKVSNKEDATDYVQIGSTSQKGFDTGVDAYIDKSTQAKDVYAQILAWAFNTTNDQSYLMKDLDGVTTDPFTNWNDATNYRSYWAVSSPVATAYGNLKFKWNEITADVGTPGYCLENTDDSNPTRVIVKAQLVDDTAAPIDLAQWYGSYYTITGLKQAVATSLANKMVVRTSGSADVAIAADDIDYAYAASGVQNPTNQQYYTIVFKLSATGNSKTWTDPTTGTILDANAETAVFAGITPAKYWKNGATYYYLPIEHLGSKNAVVRNHSYEINVEKIVGLGTPVPEPNPTDPVPPVTPEDTETYIAARINILAWKLVSNNVTLQ